MDYSNGRDPCIGESKHSQDCIMDFIPKYSSSKDQHGDNNGPKIYLKLNVDMEGIVAATIEDLL
jgi:hypothetical protein